MASVARRAIRQIPREPEAVIPALIVPIFFYVLNIGALSKITHQAAGFSFKSFELPVAVVFAVTGVSRASALVTDIQNGYFDRLMITPVRRLPLLLGLMTADLTLVMALAIPVVIVGLALGVRFHAGVLGIIVFVVLSGIWGLVFTGLPYAIALKTGNPGAVNASFILFFPITFLSTTFVPQRYLQGWLGTVANYNPMTYILQGLRSLIVGGGGIPGPDAELEPGLPRPGGPRHRGVRRRSRCRWRSWRCGGASGAPDVRGTVFRRCRRRGTAQTWNSWKSTAYSHPAAIPPKPEMLRRNSSGSKSVPRPSM